MGCGTFIFSHSAGIFIRNRTKRLGVKEMRSAGGHFCLPIDYFFPPVSERYEGVVCNYPWQWQHQKDTLAVELLESLKLSKS